MIYKKQMFNIDTNLRDRFCFNGEKKLSLILKKCEKKSDRSTENLRCIDFNL